MRCCRAVIPITRQIDSADRPTPPGRVEAVPSPRRGLRSRPVVGSAEVSRELRMPQLRRPLYQRSEGDDEDRWGLVFDTDANRLFIQHERQRGDWCGKGYGIDTEE